MGISPSTFGGDRIIEAPGFGPEREDIERLGVWYSEGRHQDLWVGFGI
jgi:hypothetical protein